jgi:hypothetical protein
LSLSLSLDAATYQPGQGITIALDEANILAAVNTVPVSDNWAYNHFQKAPCDFIGPYGLAVFSGDYNATNISTATPLTIYDPHATLLCPTNATVISFSFQPLSDTAVVNEDFGQYANNSRQFKYEVTIQGYWPDSNFSSNSRLIAFDPGVYTAVGGDEWGNLVIVHFTVAR